MNRDIEKFSQKKKVIKKYYSELHYYISPLLDDANECTAPHSLVELSTMQYYTIRDNFIHTTGAALGTWDDNEVQWYTNFIIGDTIIPRKKRNASIPCNGALKGITVGEMKCKYFGITCDIEEFKG